MSLNTQIIAILNASSSITDIVGTGTNQRIYAAIRPQKLPQLPVILIDQISSIPNATKQAVSTVDVVRVQLTLYGNYTAIQPLAALCRTALDGYVGQQDVGANYIQECWFDGKTETAETQYQVAGSMEYRGSYQITHDYMVRVLDPFTA